MNQVFRKVLEDYKRSNKANKERMIKKYGFTTEVAFITYLETADPTATPSPVDTPTDIVIAFDTTGSMRSYIGAVRLHVEETIENMFNNIPNLRLKIVAFGDYCDMASNGKFGKAYQFTELTNDKSKLIEFVRGAQNTGGGDGDEFYELVLQKILDETSWREGSNRSILLIADSDPHPIGYSWPPFVNKSQIDWRVEASKASSMCVKIDTMRIDPSCAWYTELSRITNGTCMNFKSAEKTQKIVEASAYLNSRSKEGIAATKALYRTALSMGDDELVGAYKGMAADRGISIDEK